MKFSVATIATIAFAAHQVAAAGPIAGCLETHIVTATDSCTSIAAEFQISLDDFYNMNPGLHHAGAHICDNLDSGKPYCVCTKKPCVPDTFSSNSTASGNSTTVPSASGPVSSGPAPASSGAAAPSGSASSAPSASQSAPAHSGANANTASYTAVALGAVAMMAVVLA
ncbi:hypothetical protein DM01DRAFT_1406263 [Hesseltinella vesiculosa]|uniref:LysM domain-containing protein n=1 Tax=Hesseltinella vesiculosa TaxID=101127 RepID=A0A1X2GN14_9FUNG|nr:hypothetical protein DM01DRAFT_1406263 [Hesseltinella vesiculosa]